MADETVAPERQAHDWFYFVALSGGEGRRWVEAYRRENMIEHLSRDCLKLLRDRQMAAGHDLLVWMEQCLRSMNGKETSIRYVLERWYLGVLGYYHYCVEHLDAAEDALIQAHQAVAAALERRRFLLPLANHCHEFRLHRARIARSACRWNEMHEHIALVQEMMEDQQPLCVLGDGSPIYRSTVERFYRSLSPLSYAEKASLGGLLDPELRRRQFAAFVRGIYRLPGFVIPYP